MKLHTKIFLCFLCLFVTACLPENDRSGAVRVEIAGRVFKVPKAYFDGAAATGRDEESVVLEYSLPGYEPLPPHPQYRTERQALIKEGLMKGMLLENASRRPSFDEVMPLFLEGYDYRREKPIYGLEHYVHVPPKQTRSGPEYAPYQQDDIFIERSVSGSIVSHLFCSPPKRDVNPGCSHRFVDKGLLYKTRWKISELPNWKAQQMSAIEFIDSFEKAGLEGK